MIDLSIVIVNWNTRDFLNSCLNSIAKSQMQIAALDSEQRFERKATKAEILVVDNGSTDESPTTLRIHFPWVQLIENQENVGFATANNQAIRQSRGRYILLLNSDTEVLPTALDTLVQFMDNCPEAGGCGPKLHNTDGSLQVSCYPMLTPGREFWRLLFLEKLYHRTNYAVDKWDLQKPHRVEVIKGACLLLRREALEEVGLLDERFFMYTEEIDLCFRLEQAGWVLYWIPTASIVHHGEGSSQRIAETMYIQLYRSKVQFYRKFGGSARARLFKALLTAAYFPRWLAATVGTPFIPSMAARAQTYSRLLTELPRM